MNLLARAKSSSHLFSSFSSSGEHLFYRHSITALQHCNFYATRTATTQKIPKLTNPRFQKPPPSSSAFSQGIKKPAESPTALWPKPGEIPYQAKVANFVNLIGNVKIPVRFESDSDGKHFTTIVISLGHGDLLIPVVFDGDLAHIVACHVKEGDCVFVAGQLRAEPLRLGPIENLGMFHIVAENLNFVEGFEKGVSDNKIWGSISGWGTYKLDKGPSMESFSKPLPEPAASQLGNVGFSPGKGGDESGESFAKKKESSYKPLPEPAAFYLGNVGFSPGKGGNESGESYDKKKESSSKPLPEPAAFELGNVGFSPRKGGDESGESFSKKKDVYKMGDLWRDLVNDPRKWYDYRQHKMNGLVKENFPDFKQKGTGEALWIRTAPKLLLPELGKLECDVQDLKPKEVQGGVNPGAKNPSSNLEDSWKDLVENPNKWWDNRAGKRNPKAPDFKHKETSEGLWLNRSPAWALSKLPPA